MLHYVRLRVLLMLPTLLGVSILVFMMLRVIPGDIVEIKMRSDGAAVTEDMIAAERSRLGLDKPLIEQFLDWMKGLPTLDLGTSMWTGRPVIYEIGIRFGLSLEIAVLATVIGTLVAIPLGTLAAVWRGTWLDQAVRIVSIAAIATPSFWLAMMLILLLLWIFNWLPSISYVPIWQDPVANLSQLFWPALTIGFRFAAVLTRLVRSSMLEVLGEDYVRTARAKGLPRMLILRRHTLRNALLPAITVIGLEFAFLMGGLVVTEQVFNLNGLGTLFVQSVIQHDFILIQGMVMILATTYVIVNLGVDILYAVLDPRIRYR